MSELEEILKLILELLVWLIVQLLVLFTFTVLFEPSPLPEIITVVPPPVGEPDGEGLALGEGEADGLSDGAGLPDGLADGLSEGLAEADGDGLGKLAAAANELPILPALLEKSPNTDSLSAKRTKQIRNEVKKYVLLIIFVALRQSCHPRTHPVILADICHPAPDAGSSYKIPSYKSFHSGFCCSINSNFHFLFHLFNFFSLKIASSISSDSS